MLVPTGWLRQEWRTICCDVQMKASSLRFIFRKFHIIYYAQGERPCAQSYIGCVCRGAVGSLLTVLSQLWKKSLCLEPKKEYPQGGKQHAQDYQPGLPNWIKLWWAWRFGGTFGLHAWMCLDTQKTCLQALCLAECDHLPCPSHLRRACTCCSSLSCVIIHQILAVDNIGGSVVCWQWMMLTQSIFYAFFLDDERLVCSIECCPTIRGIW